jgi:quinol monooxygenase YgiN
VIVVNAVLETTAETIEALKPAIADMEHASRAEQGCVDYCFSVELNRPGVVRVTERWESLEALQRHFRTPHMAQFQAALAEYPLGSATAWFYDARETEIER